MADNEEYRKLILYSSIQRQIRIKDYGKTDWPWSLFDPDEKKRRHETVFPEEWKKAFSMGGKLTMQSGGIHNHRMQESIFSRGKSAKTKRGPGHMSPARCVSVCQ